MEKRELRENFLLHIINDKQFSDDIHLSVSVFELRQLAEAVECQTRAIDYEGRRNKT